MLRIICMELFKYYKQHYFESLFVLTLLPIIYGLGAYYKWSAIIIGARLDLITFVSVMWSLTLMLAVPMIIFLMMIANSLSGEILGGQIILEITRTQNIRKLVWGKFISTIIVVLAFFAVNCFVSLLSYGLFLSKTNKGYQTILLFHHGNFKVATIAIYGLLLLLFLVAMATYLSVNHSVIATTIMSFSIYLILIGLSYIKQINQIIPGYLTLVSDYEWSTKVVMIQLAELVGLSMILVERAARKFRQHEF